MNEQQKDPRIQCLSLTIGDPPFSIHATVSSTAQGITIYLGGGSDPHIGAVVISTPRPSLANPSEISSTTSTYNCIGHKDDILARGWSETLCIKYQKTVVVTAGVHVDNLEPLEIDGFLDLSRQLLQQVEHALDGKKEPPQ